MAQKGSVTLDELLLLEVDGDPSLGAGVAAPISSFALLNNPPAYGVWLKIGVPDTAWSKLTENSVANITTSDDGNTQLTSASAKTQIINGTGENYTLFLPDASTLTVGDFFRIVNYNEEHVTLADFQGNYITQVTSKGALDLQLTNQITSAGTWAIRSEYADPTSKRMLFEEFLSPDTDSPQSLGWKITKSGSGSGESQYSPTVNDQDTLGIAQISTGTNSSGRCTYATNLGLYWFGQDDASDYFEITWKIRLPVLSSEVQSYTFYAGFGDATGSGDMTDGVYFQYTRGTSHNWLLKSSKASTRTTVVSSVPVDTLWHKFRIRINGNGSLAEFFIDDVLVGSITTNIPNTVSNLVGILTKIEKTAGTTEIVALLDYLYGVYYE